MNSEIVNNQQVQEFKEFNIKPIVLPSHKKKYNIGKIKFSGSALDISTNNIMFQNGNLYSTINLSGLNSQSHTFSNNFFKNGEKFANSLVLQNDLIVNELKDSNEKISFDEALSVISDANSISDSKSAFLELKAFNEKPEELRTVIYFPEKLSSKLVIPFLLKNRATIISQKKYIPWKISLYITLFRYYGIDILEESKKILNDFVFKENTYLSDIINFEINYHEAKTKISEEFENEKTKIKDSVQEESKYKDEYKKLKEKFKLLNEQKCKELLDSFKIKSEDFYDIENKFKNDFPECNDNVIKNVFLMELLYLDAVIKLPDQSKPKYLDNLLTNHLNILRKVNGLEENQIYIADEYNNTYMKPLKSCFYGQNFAKNKNRKRTRNYFLVLVNAILKIYLTNKGKLSENFIPFQIGFFINSREWFNGSFFWLCNEYTLYRKDVKGLRMIQFLDTISSIKILHKEFMNSFVEFAQLLKDNPNMKKYERFIGILHPDIAEKYKNENLKKFREIFVIFKSIVILQPMYIHKIFNLKVQKIINPNDAFRLYTLSNTGKALDLTIPSLRSVMGEDWRKNYKSGIVDFIHQRLRNTYFGKFITWDCDMIKAYQIRIPEISNKIDYPIWKDDFSLYGSDQNEEYQSKVKEKLNSIIKNNPRKYISKNQDIELNPNFNNNQFNIDNTKLSSTIFKQSQPELSIEKKMEIRNKFMSNDSMLSKVKYDAMNLEIREAKKQRAKKLEEMRNKLWKKSNIINNITPIESKD